MAQLLLALLHRVYPLLTLAVLPADDAGPDDSRNALGMLFVDGEFNISRQNYFVYWFVVGLSFIAPPPHRPRRGRPG